MNKYRIFLRGEVSAAVEVEADDYQQAVELAIEEAPQTDFGFAKFEPVEEWVAANDYYRNGLYIDPDSTTYGE